MPDPFRFADCANTATSTINKVASWLEEKEIETSGVIWHEKRRIINIPQLQTKLIVRINPEVDKPHVKITIKSDEKKVGLGQFSSGREAREAVIGWIKENHHKKLLEPTE